VAEARRVVYLTAGDPFVFERADSVAEALAEAGIAIEIVPGITSALAAAPYAGISLSGEGLASAVCLAAGGSHHGPAIPPSDLTAMARTGTLVLYIAEEHLERTCGELRAHGLSDDTPATIVEEATEPGQRVVAGTLATLAAEARRAGIRSPALVFVGAHATPRPALGWRDRRRPTGDTS
jgi:siroheme synthase